MNYQNTVARRSYFRQASRRRKTRHFVVNGTKLAMLIIPIVLLTILLTFEFGSHGTNETPKLDTVQANGNGINPGCNAHTLTIYSHKKRGLRFYEVLVFLLLLLYSLGETPLTRLNIFEKLN